MRFVVALTLSTLAQTPAPVEPVSSFPPRSAFEERKALHVPEGFQVQLVAAEPAIPKPMNIAFDDRGRLWVTGSVEYPYPAKEGTTPRDAVKILDDFQPDGRAGRIATFAGGLNIPIGLLPLTGGEGALVYSIPSIDRFLDTDGDGRADRRDPLYKTYGHRDTHGMTGSFAWGFDGWVYACHGFANDSTIEGADRMPILMNSGNVYRMKLDGSHAEYFTHGQVNPFGLAFDPLGNLYSSDCHTLPLYQLLRGAYYPSFGKPDDGLGFGPRMMNHNHGSTAIDGATYYAADQFPAAYRDTLFVGNVVTNRINHDRLEWRGSSPWAVAQPDFLWSEDNWFRPVDIELGPDGALYVADFYNKIIGHYEVPLTHPGRDHDHGRIWRIVYRGSAGKEKGRGADSLADWTTATIDELVEGLGHPNLAVRTRVANQLVERQAPRLDERLADLVRSGENPWRRIHALWVLERRSRLDDATLDQAVGDPSRELRVHAMRVLADRSSLNDARRLQARKALEDSDPLVSRCAAEVLGRHPDIANIRPLLDLRQRAPEEDTHLIHAVRMALRDQLLPGKAWTSLAELAPSERDARDIADVATGVPTAESALYLLDHLEHHDVPAETLIRYVHHVARYGTEEGGGRLLSFVRGRSDDGPARMAALVKAILKGTEERGARIGDEARGLALELTRTWLDSENADRVLLGIDLAKTFKLSEVREPLERRVAEPQARAAQRAEALAALVALDPKPTIPLLDRVLGDAAAPPLLRDRASTLLASIDQADARDVLLRALPAASERLQTTIAAGLAARAQGAEALLRSIEEGKASARLLQQPRVALLLGNSGVADVNSRTAALLKGLPPADQKLRDLLRQRRESFASAPRDPAQGARVFEKNCAACHQIGGKGARVGPQLDGVGSRGADRLLEDVLDPNRNVDQAFRVTNLALSDGQLVSGLLLKEEGAVLVLADAQGKEVRVPRDQVEERATTPLSPMPANMTDQIPESELYDLLAYLLLQKDKPASPGN